MSKLLYSNMEEKFNLLDEMFHESGFQDNFKDGSLAVYKKLRLNNENCYIEYENGEVAYVCTAVGTFFFNGKLESAGVLREVCEQYKKGGALEQLKEQSEGCYCLFIKDYMNDKTVIFVDDYNLFNCYYSIDIDGNYLVTNTYWHIAMALNKEMDKLKTLEYALTYTILDSGTPYTGISRLKGDEYLCIEDNRINIQKIRGGGAKKNVSYEQILHTLMEGIDKNARLIKENFSTFSVCATGGMDSRITLAALIQKKLRPRLVYWVGDSIMTGTESQDEKIVTEISKIMNLEKKIVKAPTVSYPDNAGYMETSLKKYGELYHIFGCNKYIFAMYEDENIIGDFHDFGVGTNWLKSCEQAAFPMFQEEFGGDLELTVERVIKKIYFRSEVEQALGDEYEDFYEMVKDEVMTFLEKNHIKNKKLSRENVSLLSLEYFKRANSFNYNMANYYTYSFPVAVTKEISKIIADTDYSFRENNHLVVDLFVHICQSEKALLGIPFYSDIKIQKVDFDKKTMYEPKKILFRKKIVEMKRFLIKGQIYEILRKMYHNLTNKKQGDEYDAIDYWTSPLKEYLNKSDIYCKFDLSEFQKNAHFSSVIDIFFMVWATEYYRSDHFIDKHSEIKGGNCK